MMSRAAASVMPGLFFHHGFDAEVDHLLHGAFPGKGSVFVAVLAIVGALASVLFGPVHRVVRAHGHAAALTVLFLHPDRLQW